MQEIPALAKFSPLPSFEDFINNENFGGDAILKDAGEVTCKTIIGKIHEEARLVNDRFTDLSSHMDDHIRLTLQALQAAKDECIRILRHSESLNLNIEKLEARSQAQEFEISSLQAEAMRLLSACSDATQELQVKMYDLLCFDSEPEDVDFGLDTSSPASFRGEVEKKDFSEFAQAADNLSFTCRKVISRSQNLVKINKDMSISLENLKHELNYAEMTAETAINARKLIQERVLKLEEDMDELQKSHNKMNAKLNDYQSKEDLIKGKEVLFDFAVFNDLTFFFFSGVEDEMISKDQVGVLLDKVNELIVLADSPGQSESQSQELYFSSPIDKLFYVVDKFPEFQHGFYSLTLEKEDLQLTLANRIGIDHHDLESKKWELSEVTAILEKIMQKFAGNYSLEDPKPVTAMELIRILERQMMVFSVDLKNSKSEVHDLGDKLQAKELIINELSAKVQYLEDSHARIQQPDVKERTAFEPSTTMMRPEITEIEEAVRLFSIDLLFKVFICFIIDSFFMHFV